MFPVFLLLKIHLEDESSTTKICFIRPSRDIRLSRTIFEYLTYDSKKVYDIHNFIFGLLAVTGRKTSFVFVLQMQLF